MIDITPAIRSLAPGVDAMTWAHTLTEPMRATGLVTSRRAAMFLGQCFVESAGLRDTEEDLDYTHPARLRETWPDRFPVGTDPTPYLNHPEALANYVYAGRNGNGDAKSGDGWRFRGRGLIQITGRITYTDFAHALGKDPDEIADWVATPEGAARSACWFWTWASHGALMRAADEWVITDATRLINPALMGVGARIDACNRALAALAEPRPALAPVSADDLNATEMQSLQPAPAGSPATSE